MQQKILTILPVLRTLYFVAQYSQFAEKRASCLILQGDQKVSVHLMITIQKVTSNISCLATWLNLTAW
jgi:hypothetical protein